MNNDYLKINTEIKVPFHMHYLRKEEKNKTILNLSYIEEYKANGHVGNFYKPNSNIL